MGGQPRHHAVEAHWILDGRYLQVSTSALDDSGYEAPSTNRVTRDDDEDAWRWDLSYRQHGETIEFATKRMVRTST